MRNYLFALLLVLSNCNTEKGVGDDIETVFIIEKNKPLTIDSEVSFVQLETSEECLLNYIVNIEVTNNYIYVLDRNTFYVFDTVGKFIKKIKRGKGPGELTRPMNFNIDEARKEIAIIDGARFLHIYNLDAEYKETHFLEGSFLDAYRIDNEHFLVHTSLPSIFEEHLVSVYDIKKKEIVQKHISAKDLLIKNLTALTYNNFTKINGKVFYSAANVRGIYEYTPDQGMVLYKKFDFGKNEPGEMYVESFGRDGGSFMKQAYEDNFIGFINYYYPLTTFSLVGLKYKEFNCGVINKDNSSKMYLTTVPELFNLPTTSSFQYPKNANNNKMYFVYYNDLLVDEEEESAFLEIGSKKIQLQENANPILVTLNFKN